MRSRGQGTPVRPVSHPSPALCRPPAAAPCPPARARAPAGSTSEGSDRVPSGLCPCPPCPRAADLAQRRTRSRFATKDRKGHFVLLIRSGRAGLQSPSVQFTPYLSSPTSRRRVGGPGTQALGPGPAPFEKWFPSCLLVNTSLWQLTGFVSFSGSLFAGSQVSWSF